MSLSLRDGVAVLTIDNPPVNALGPQSIAPLMQALDEAQADAAVRAVVLGGSGGTFSGGADMRGFAGARSGPTIRELIERLEASAKPVVAAIEGNCLGGGLEVALGCNYRVAG
ncbi:MAG: enoyl-CoA hydratase-related protein, partial [Pseudomonadota bacterium]|nr:enoyl-CoA hydratase-related protein [Pseudomonadota bacterium]